MYRNAFWYVSFILAMFRLCLCLGAKLVSGRFSNVPCYPFRNHPMRISCWVSSANDIPKLESFLIDLPCYLQGFPFPLSCEGQRG